MNVPVGYVVTSMIRPSNWASRWLWSLWMVAIATVKAAAVTVLPLMVRSPLMWLVRPTAMLFWPSSTSFTRYPATEPVVTRQAPESDPVLAAWLDWPGEADASPLVTLRLSGAGAGPSMKWMYTYVPPTASTATAATPATVHRSQRSGRRDGTNTSSGDHRGRRCGAPADHDYQPERECSRALRPRS